MICRYAIITYYGMIVEPIASAIKCLQNDKGNDQHVEWVDIPLYKWRQDQHDKKENYLEDCIIILKGCTKALFWYHGLSAIELKKLKDKCETTRFYLWTWDDPYDWDSPCLNNQSTKHYYDGIITCCQESVPWYENVNTKMCFPGYVQRFADKAFTTFQGPDRFVCDVSIMCTNLYEDMDLYPNQIIPRKDLVDALYLHSTIQFHLYGPKMFSELYPRCYKGFASFEKTHEICRTSKCCISTHVVSKGITQYANERTIIVLGCGGLLATDLIPAPGIGFDLGNNVCNAIRAVESLIQMKYEDAEHYRNMGRKWAQDHFTWSHWSTVVKQVMNNINDHENIPSQSSVSIQSSQEHKNNSMDLIGNVCNFKKFSLPFLGSFNKCISIGEWCIGADHIRRNNYRDGAYPFDWVFSNLSLVIESIKNPYIVYDEFLTPEKERTLCNLPWVYKSLQFPHHILCEKDMNHYKRSCERWKMVINNTHQSILLIHVTRPYQSFDHVIQHIDQLEKMLPPNFFILVVFQKNWSSDTIPDCINWACTIELTQRHLFILAHVSSEWNGENWTADQHSGIWQEIMKTFTITSIF